MRVEVVVFGVLRDHLPPSSEGNRVTLDLPESTTVADIAAALDLPPAALFSVLIDGQRADSTAPVPDGSEVTLMPPFTGGRQ